MRKILLTLISMFICVLAYANDVNPVPPPLGYHIPADRLPTLEQDLSNPTSPYTVLPWQNAGCLERIEENGGLVIDKIIDVTKDLSGNVTLSQEINEMLSDNEILSEHLMFYFPPGEYELDETIIVNRPNVIFRGAGSDKSILKFTKPWEFDLRYDLFFVDENVSNVGFENLKFKNIGRSIGEDQSSVNQYKGMYIYFNKSLYSWVEGCQFEKSQRHSIYVLNSKYISVRNSYFVNVESVADGGNGYGIQLMGPGTRYCLIENNIFRRQRHAIVLQAEAKYNVVGYNYQRDSRVAEIVGCPDVKISQICFHGTSSGISSNGPTFNLVEGNIVDYIAFDMAHGFNGPNNLIFRNKASKMCDTGFDSDGWPDYHDNDNQCIVNNYFKFTDNNALGWPWIVRGDNHYKKNNKTKYWKLDPDWQDVDWHDHSIEFWNDVSYYRTSRPDFIPDNQWPFHPTDSETGTDINNNNPAKDRWDSIYKKTVDIDNSHIYLKDTRKEVDVKFYQYTNPITGDTSKELYVGYNQLLPNPNIDKHVEIHILQNGKIIADYNNKSVKMKSTHNEKLPFEHVAISKRIPITTGSTDRIIVVITDLENKSKAYFGEYSNGDLPPVPVFNNMDENIVYATYGATNQGTDLYFLKNQRIKWLAPYSGSVDISYEPKLIIKDDSEHSKILPSEYYSYENDGSIFINVPSRAKIESWGITDTHPRLQFHINLFNPGFNGENSHYTYADIYNYNNFIYLKEYTSGGGCPTLFYEDKIVNNILSLGENQKEDALEYSVLENVKSDNLSFTIYENKNNQNFLDAVHLVKVEHDKNSKIGVTSEGETFSYNPKKRIEFLSNREDEIHVSANDTLYFAFDDIEMTENVDFFIKQTAYKNVTRDFNHGGKGGTGIGTIKTNRDSSSTIIFDNVGIHEQPYTSYSAIPDSVLINNNGRFFLVPTSDIDISELSLFIASNDRAEINVEECVLSSATTIKNNEDVRTQLFLNDDVHHEFGFEEGVDLTFANNSVSDSFCSYVFVANGRYENLEDKVDNEVPSSYNLANYPNPFNPSTTINFSIPEKGRVDISVYNIKGQKVKAITDKEFEIGNYSIIWNGDNSANQPVASGVYFYKLSINGKQKAVEKMLLLK